MSSISISIQYLQNNYPITISETATIQTLISKLCEKNNSLAAGDTSLFFGGIVAPSIKTLKELGIKNGNILIQTKKNLNEIPGLIVSFEPDMITLDSSSEHRAKMPCGHVISRESMTDFLRDLIRRRIYLIECPGQNSEAKTCRVVWDFALCSKVGVLTKEERLEFETGFAKNLILTLFKAKNCPQCSSLVMKPETINNQVSCIKCNNNFCWICMKKWKGGGKDCGNFGCGSTEDQVKILADCKTKDIGDKIKNIPEIRACPNCKSMIMHASNCKHMTCYDCKKVFCFMCLGLKKEIKNSNGLEWDCGGAYEKCPYLAPRQTEL